MPSHSQSLANIVANVHSQVLSAAKTISSSFHLRNHSPLLANKFQHLLRNFLFEIWWLKFASDFSGCVGIRMCIRSRVAATAVRSDGAATEGVDKRGV